MSSSNAGPSNSYQNPYSFVEEPSKSKNHLQFRKDQLHIRKVPFYLRHARPLAALGWCLTLGILFSQPLYYFFKDPSTVKYEDTLWPSEKRSGKTNVERLRERILRQQKRREEAAAQAAALKAEKAAQEAAKAAEKAEQRAARFAQKNESIWNQF